jgi:DNA-binding IclR family transcriptional regulator
MWVITCLIIGNEALGVSNRDMSIHLGLHRHTCYMRLLRLRDLGYITMDKRTYKLAPNGQKVYDAAMAVMNTELPALVKWLAAEARKENKKADLAA